MSLVVGIDEATARGTAHGDTGGEPASNALAGENMIDGSGKPETPSDDDVTGPHNGANARDYIAPMAASLHEYALFTTDTHGYVTSWNPGAQRMLGYRAGEIVGKHIAIWYGQEQLEAGLPGRILHEAAEAGTTTATGWRLRKDGSLLWASVVFIALRTGDGALDGFIVLSREDTEVHNRLERSSQQFSDLFEVTPVAIGLFDDAERFLLANSALCDLLGYRPDVDNALGSDLIHPDYPAESLLPCDTAPASQSDRPTLPHRVLARADGQPVFCDLHISRSTRESGEQFWMVVFQDVTERRRESERLHHRATHDDLTGLPNHAMLGTLLSAADPEHAAVVYCDIDNFKRINDSLGRTVGDELIVTLARRLEAGLPNGWSAVHMSGDEFVVICPNAEEAGGVSSIIATVTRLMCTTLPLRDQLVRVSCSFGIAVLDDFEAGSEDLVRFASAAMFEAKQGSERIARATPELITSVDRQVNLEVELRDAIDGDTLSLLYQPIVAADGSIVAAEALLRWPHPERGLLTPDVILPVAEQGGLLRDLDHWVLHTALTDAAQWPAPEGPVAVTVNLLGLVPGVPSFAELVRNTVASSGIAWDSVILELVETCLIDIPSRSRRAMGELIDHGVRFAVDDFGTGYSSLARLKDFPVQIIKADRQFVQRIGTNPADLAIVRAVADLSRAMRCLCVAEGVETRNQFNVLRGVGLDAYQGWLFSPAVESQKLSSLIKDGPLSFIRD
ncbi:putative bifunctional diguanylate cyclase/phosphodiesterase [Saccharopolyspora sp. 5N708]|uniref:putative bifunctional diguanylate cyclase/phosphodiesterase n=1 Tax=Saccharopolyspora sp. 5N708 TaxID=3457424 RepID=UPI003FD62455